VFKDLTEICLKGCNADIEDGKFDRDWKNSEMSYVIKKLESYVGMIESNTYSDNPLRGTNPNIKSNYEAETGRMWKLLEKDWFFQSNSS
jgi:hypothetical protein